MKTKHIIQTAAVSGALAVILGAFGAHGLEPILEKTGRLATYETAVSYHFYHSLALLMLGILSANFPQSNAFKQGAWFFIAGIIVFSGSLYVLSITGVTILGAVTPFGGVAFILGWAWLFWGAAKINSHS
ncbi:DUF423 domain-containing protein [Lunatibacter salilacus]|uniref:DUF423 domain-containing protein n=1 Tax=Lunatibacter salilacus TaxID=2483804 RepID=UPI00131BF271|nr:DUF423 domain-containing protein [Lunatibacter salilacus]